MPAGLEIFDASGQRILSITDRITRIVGAVQVSSTGSIAVPEFAQGSAWWIINALETAGAFSGKGPPTVYQSGNSLVWDYGTYAKRQSVYITYGVY